MMKSQTEAASRNAPPVATMFQKSQPVPVG